MPSQEGKTSSCKLTPPGAISICWFRSVTVPCHCRPICDWRLASKGLLILIVVVALLFVRPYWSSPARSSNDSGFVHHCCDIGSGGVWTKPLLITAINRGVSYLCNNAGASILFPDFIPVSQGPKPVLSVLCAETLLCSNCPYFIRTVAILCHYIIMYGMNP